MLKEKPIMFKNKEKQIKADSFFRFKLSAFQCRSHLLLFYAKPV